VKTFVKLCGLTDEATARAVPDGGAAGFVLEVPDSPRNLSWEAAGRLAAAVPNGAEIWAVTRDPSAALIRRLFDELGVDRIQVFGTVPPQLEFLESHHVVPSLPVPLAGPAGPDPPVPRPEDHPIVHLDAVGDPLPSGSPVAPDWEVCRRLTDAHPGRKFVLSGGLTPENVGAALAAVAPWGVDVASGVESRPGVKEPGRIAAFLEAVAAAEKGLG